MSLSLRYFYFLPRGPRGPGPLEGGGGVLPSAAFPEPAACSYGAPGVEFMGLHRENNAVVQIHFLPGQVRGPSTPSCSHATQKGCTYGEAGIWRPWVWF